MQDDLKKEREREIERDSSYQMNLSLLKAKYNNLQQKCECTYFKSCLYCRERDSLRVKPVIHPLPERNNDAKKVVFFARIPEILQACGNLSILAHSLFCNTKMHHKEIPIDSLAWIAKYDFKPTQLRVPRLISLGSLRKPLVTDSHFKYYAGFSEESYHPDFDLVLSAIISGRKCIVDIPKYDFTQFTEDTRGGLKHLNWIADAAHTENMVLAEQSEMPSEMTKSEFLTFGFMRAAPLLQIRRLAQALSEPHISLDNPDFLCLVRRVLYELGPISQRDDHSRWEWKHDLFSNEWMDKLHRSLQQIVKHVEQSWQSHKTMLLVIECATYLSQFDSGSDKRFLYLLRECHRIVVTWCDEVKELEQENITNADAVKKWRLLLVQFYSYNLLASIPVGVDCDTLITRRRLRDLKHLCTTDQLNGLAVLLGSVDVLICTREHDIHSLLIKNFGWLDKILSNATGRTFSGLKWKIITEDKMSTSWFTTDEVTGNSKYEVNPFEGLVLHNGSTISELPSIISQHPLYQSVMRNANFIVRPLLTQRLYNCLSEINDCTYSFGLWIFESKEYAYVVEESKHQKSKKVLVPPDLLADCQLPSQLISNFSHWIDFEAKKMYFRPKDFRQQTIHWTACLTDDLIQARIIQYNTTYQLLPATIPAFSPLISIFQKLDSEENIHFLKSENLSIFFARYNLTLSISKGKGFIESKDFPGYHLSSNQSIPTLPMLHAYLVFIPSTYKFTTQPIVVIPNGNVQYDNSSFIEIMPNENTASFPYYQYQLDLDLECLIAPSVKSRLYLAYLYALSSVLLPDPMTAQTGFETALGLLRQCWQNRPYSEEEWQLLSKIDNLTTPSQPSATLWLMVYYLMQTSQKILFMYPGLPERVLPTEKFNVYKVGYWKAKKWQSPSSLLTMEEEVTLFGQLLSLDTNKYSHHRYQLNYFELSPDIFFSKEKLNISLQDFFGSKVLKNINNHQIT